MTSAPSAIGYRERLWPGFSLFIVLLLIIPAVTLMLWPVNAVIAMPVGIALYALLAGTLVLTSPIIEITDGRLTAGRATIPVSALGDVELMGAERLRATIGPELDARSYLVIRGWIHQGIRIDNIDEKDPAPHWILTSRTPQKLAIALRDAQAR